MKTKRLFTALMMATMMSCGIILAQPGQKDKKLTPEQRIEMQVKKHSNVFFWTKQLLQNSHRCTKSIWKQCSNASLPARNCKR